MKRLNIGVLAHVDAGKTTLVERILYDADVIRQMGKIESGNTVMDSLELERTRGVSIKNSYTMFQHQGVQINLIDTPGHYDFVDEVEHVLEVLDAVVLVVSGIDGIQSQTKKFWRQLQAYGLPTIIFVNKVDYQFYDQQAILSQIKRLLSQSVVYLESDASDLQLSEDDLYTLVEGDEVLEEALLEKGFADDEIEPLFFERFNQGKIYPIISGSAKEGLGVARLLSLITHVEAKVTGEELAGFVYKVVYDKNLGKGCYIRLFGGTLSPRDTVKFKREGSSEHKISQLKQLVGGKVKELKQAVAGEIVIVYGLADGRVGDALGAYRPLNIQKTPPLFLLSLQETSGKVRDLQKAVFELSEEYPALTYQWFEETAEVQLTVMGEMQADIIRYELTERFGLSIQVGEPRIIYQETPSHSAIGFEAYTMPKPSWAILKFLIEPAPRNSGYRFINQANNDQLLPRYHSQIEDSLMDALRIGRLGWQVVDLTITLLEGESHREHTHPLDFALATPIALQGGLEQANMKLLEPTMLLKITTTTEHLSKVVADIIAMEGQILTETYTAQEGNLEALVPLATSLEYGTLFFKQTKGEGGLEQSFHSYQECPDSRYETQARRGVDPLEREKWILHRRGAIS